MVAGAYQGAAADELPRRRCESLNRLAGRSPVSLTVRVHQWNHYQNPKEKLLLRSHPMNRTFGVPILSDTRSKLKILGAEWLMLSSRGETWTQDRRKKRGEPMCLHWFTAP